MWPFPDLLAEHFQELKASRDDGSDTDEEVPMQKNEDARLKAIRAKMRG